MAKMEQFQKWFKETFCNSCGDRAECEECAPLKGLYAEVWHDALELFLERSKSRNIQEDIKEEIEG